MGTALTLDRYAEMRARMEAGELRDEVLARAGLTVDEWMAAQRDWLERMATELEHGCFELTNRYTQAFLEQQRAILAASPPVSAPRVDPSPASAPPDPVLTALPRGTAAPRRSAPPGLTGTAPLEDMSAIVAALPFVPSAPSGPVPPTPPPARPAPHRSAPPGLTGTAPIRDMSAIVAALPFSPGPEPRRAPATPPAAAVAARTAPALSLEHYAALCAELSLDPRRAPEIYPRYGLHDATAWQATDAEWQARMHSDAALAARWQQLTAHYRAYYRKR
ncbi:hypothetical protein [Sorangium sp. So ce1024]|uniref:hypothetical protein n=1 Tax=unclassified Sorangium TaxID=2621164 RepID=UPI003F0CB6F3